MQRIISVLTIMALVVGISFIPALGQTAPTTLATGGSISGSVVDKDGNALGAGIEIKLFKAAKHAGKHGAKAQNAGGGKGAHQRAAALMTVTTDSNGKFTFTGIDAGDYLVAGRLKGTGQGHASVTVADVAVSVTVTLEKGKPAGGRGKHAKAT